MKVFISWSGDLSRKVALVLRDWIPSVIQALEPYVSSEDIDKGARWSTDISAELEGSNFGILVVTKHNINAPWLNFEAGALSKSFETSRVSPFLFGVKRSEVQGPLLQFQSTIYEKEDVFKLVSSLNSACGDAALDPGRLEDVLEVWWPRLEQRLDELRPEAETDPSSEAESTAEGSQRPPTEILEEILDLVRRQQRMLSSPDEILPLGYLEMALDRVRRGASFPPDHPVYRDLAEGYRRLVDAVENLPPDSQPLEVLEALDRIHRPLSFLLSEVDDPRLMRRLLRPPRLQGS